LQESQVWSVKQVLQSTLHGKIQLSKVVSQLAHLVLSQTRHSPSFKNSPITHESQVPSTIHVRQSELHSNIQLVSEVIQVAHLV